MKSFSKLLSLFLALVMLLGVIIVAPVSVSAVESGKLSTAIDDDDNDDDDGDPFVLPEGDMAKPVSLEVDPIEIYEDIDAESTTSFTDEYGSVNWLQYQFSDLIKYTVILEDGTKLESDDYGSVEYNDEDFDIDFEDHQSYENQWGVGAYNVDYSILGLKTSATVTVLESPIKDVEFTDITCVEGTNGEATSYYAWDDVSDSVKFKSSFFKYNDAPKFSVTLKNGEKLQSEDGCVSLLGKTINAKIYTQQYLEPWTVGTRELTAEFLGKEYTYNYIITESDIKSISVDDLTVYDGLDYTQSYYYSYGEKIPYNCYNYNPTITITLNDGTQYQKTLDDETFTVGDTSYSIKKCDDQDDDNEWGVGNHDAYIFVGAKQKKITVTVAENPIDQLIVDDIDVHYGVGGDWVYSWDEDDYWFKYSYAPAFSAKLKDGTTLSGENGAVKLNGKEYKLSFEDDQTFDTQWEPDKEYTVSASIGNKNAEFKAKVKNDTVKSVRLIKDKITVQQGTDSYLYDDEENSYKKLNYCKYVEMEITMFDGTVIKPDDDGCYWYDDNELEVEFVDDQSKDNLWDVGTHKATATVLNASVTFDVTVEPNPVSMVEVSNVKIIEGTNKIYIGLDKSYYSYNPDYKVILTDGTVLESDSNHIVRYQNDWYTLETKDNQKESPWTVGKHIVEGTILGVSAEFEVEIIPSPVKSVTVEPMQLIENASGLWKSDYDDKTDTETDEYFYYNSTPAAYTVTLNDGTVLKSDEQGDIYYQGECYSLMDVVDNQSYDTKWTTGNTYTCTASVLGFPFTYEATVTNTPVKSVNAVLTLIEGCDDSVVYDDDDKEWSYYNYDEEMVQLEVTLNNGKVLKSEQGYIEYNGESFGVTNIQDDQSPTNQWTAGNTYQATAEVMGNTINIDVKIIKNPVKKVKVNGDCKVIEKSESDGSLREYFEGDKLVGTYYYYDNINPIDYVVTFNDGNAVKSDKEGFITYAGRKFAICYDEESTNQGYYNQWEAGKTYSATGSIMGFKVNYNVILASGNKPTTITLKAKNKSISIGKTTTVIADVKNPVGKTKFTSSNTKIATVNSKGLVTAIASGKVTITAINNGKKAVESITIKKLANPAKIKISKKSVSYKKLTKKNQVVKPISVKEKKLRVTYKKTKGNARISINKKTGKITFKKGMAKKNYKITIKIKVAGNKKYNKLNKKVTLSIAVK